MGPEIRALVASCSSTFQLPGSTTLKPISRKLIKPSGVAVGFGVRVMVGRIVGVGVKVGRRVAVGVGVVVEVGRGVGVALGRLVGEGVAARQAPSARHCARRTRAIRRR